MQIWQLQEAKAKLTQLINEAQSEPQIISRHGKKESVVMSYKKYQDLIGKKENAFTFFRKSPLVGCDLNLERDKSEFRDIDL